jgi:penicillin-binding protein 2
VFHNWRARSAVISLGQALVESCDTVFYRFAANWWAKERRIEKDGKRPYEIMQDWDRRFGLGRPTGIDLPGEVAGNVPDRAQRLATWKKHRKAWCAQARKTRDVLLDDLCERGFLWRGGDAINLSIGQGELQVSPLQLAVAYAAIANGGKVMRPHLGMKIVAPSGKTSRVVKPEVRRTVKVDAADIDYVHRALARVPQVGTAAFPFRGWPFSNISAAAKTGSAEIAGKQPFSWFAAYAPAGGPQYVGASVVEQAGFGSQVSGPVVRRIFDELFELPPTPIVFGARSD